MMIFGVCFILYSIKLSVGKGSRVSIQVTYKLSTIKEYLAKNGYTVRITFRYLDQAF